MVKRKKIGYAVEGSERKNFCTLEMTEQREAQSTKQIEQVRAHYLHSFLTRDLIIPHVKEDKK